jgi:hypothetical protein
MWRSRLIPRFIAGLGLAGGPLLFGSATAVLFGAFKQVSLPGAVAPLPVFAWELGLAFFLIVKGFRVAGAGQAGTPRATGARLALAARDRPCPGTPRPTHGISRW